MQKIYLITSFFIVLFLINQSFSEKIPAIEKQDSLINGKASVWGVWVEGGVGIKKTAIRHDSGDGTMTGLRGGLYGKINRVVMGYEYLYMEELQINILGFAHKPLNVTNENILLCGCSFIKHNEMDLVLLGGIAIISGKERLDSLVSKDSTFGTTRYYNYKKIMELGLALEIKFFWKPKPYFGCGASFLGIISKNASSIGFFGFVAFGKMPKKLMLKNKQ